MLVQLSTLQSSGFELLAFARKALDKISECALKNLSKILKDHEIASKRDSIRSRAINVVLDHSEELKKAVQRSLA